MKITKTQLKEIINEELGRVLNENDPESAAYGLEEQIINELGIGTALKGLGGAIKGKAFDKVKGMKGPVAQDVQAQKQIQRIVADMVKKDPDSAALYAQFLTKLAQSIAPAKTGEAGFEE